MSTRLPLIFCAGFALALMAVVFWQSQQSPGALTSFQSASLLPEQRSHLPKAQQIQLQQAGESLILHQKQGVWQTAEGHPINPERISRLLSQLAQTKRLEPRTQEPDLLHHLGLDDPIGGESGSLGMTISNEKGIPFVRLVFGKEPGAESGFLKARYVRQWQETQGWLVSGPINASFNLADWVGSEWSDIDQQAISRIQVQPLMGVGYTLQQAEGAGVGAMPTLSRSFAAPVQGYSLKEPSLPLGQRLDQRQAQASFRVLSSLPLRGIRPLNQNTSPSHIVSIHFRSGEVLKLSVQSDPSDQDHLWVQLIVDIGGEYFPPQGINPYLRPGWAYQIPIERMDDLIRPLESFLTAKLF